MDESGYNACVTCKVIKHWKELQAGHFLPGRGNAVLFSEEGVWPQCYHCNVGLKGDWPRYYEFIKGKYGVERVNQMIQESRIPVKYSITDYQAIEERYKAEVI